LGINTSTVHRWLNDGFIAGEQVTPGAPWQIRITDELRALFVEQAPPGYLPMLETTMKLGVSRQTVLQRGRDTTSRSVSPSIVSQIWMYSLRFRSKDE
jgi:hypothetical protein